MAERELLRKNHRAFVKAAADGSGIYEAIVSVFGNVDDGYDRVVAGAFAESIKADPHPPVVWSHMWNIPPIGETLEIAELAAGDPKLEGTGLEDLGGLWTHSRLFVGKAEDHQVARQVYAGMKAEHQPVREFSFAYEVMASQWVTEDGVEIRELLQVGLFEHGPTLVGMNRATQLLQVASNPLGTPPSPPGPAGPPPAGDTSKSILPERLVEVLTTPRRHGG